MILSPGRGADGSQMIAGDGFERRMIGFSIKIGNDFRLDSWFSFGTWLCGKRRNIGDGKRMICRNSGFLSKFPIFQNSILGRRLA